MATTNLGTTLSIAGQTSLTSYIVESDEVGGNEVDSEDINDGAGAKTASLIYGIYPKRKLNLICKTGANPVTDFPEGLKCAITALSNYIVESSSISYTRGATRATVSLINKGF